MIRFCPKCCNRMTIQVWIQIGGEVIMRKFIVILVLAVMFCPVFGAKYLRKGMQSIEFELNPETADILVSDIIDERATFKCFDDEETLFIWYTDSDGKLTDIIALTPEEFNYLKAYFETYILKYTE